MVASEYQIKLEGADELIRKLESESLIGKPIRRLFSKVGIQGKNAAKSSAPLATGRLNASITTRMSGKQVPTFIAVRVGAVNPRGYSYPRLLEFSPRHGHREWLLRAFRGAIGGLVGFMHETAGAIEDQFRTTK